MRITNILWSIPPGFNAKPGSEFWDQIVNFWFYDFKNFLVRIWDRPDLPGRYWTIPGHYRPICLF